jgi:hypothetical protein
MSTNIVQLITSQLGGGAISKLSSLLGESSERTQSAVGAAVPTLLAGLTHVASTPDGAQRLAGAINQQDPDVTTNFASTADSSSAGSNILSNLFGGSVLNSVTSVIGRFTGMKTASAGSLLGMIAPLALGFLGKQQRTMGLDSSGLASMLTDQKQNIANAMPSGLSNLLGSIPGFGGLTQKMPKEETAYAGAAPSYTGTSYGSGQSQPVSPIPPRQHASPLRWLLPLLIAALVLWGLWALTHRPTTPTVIEQPTTTIQSPVTPTVGVADITSSLRDNLTSATTTLGGITDASSAEQAAPQISQANDKIAAIRTQIDKLPASAKSTALSAMQPMVMKAQQLCAKVRAMPGVGASLQNTLDQFNNNLSALTATNP